MSTELTTAANTEVAVADMTEQQMMALSGQEEARTGLARLSINTAADDDDGNQVPPGHFTVQDQASGNTLYAETIKFRPFVKRYQYRRYDPKGGDSGEGATTNRSRLIATFKEEAWDELGTIRCGKLKGYWKMKDTLEAAVQVDQEQVSCYLMLFGVVTMVNPVNAAGESFPDTDVPALWNCRGNNYQELEALTKLIGDRKLKMWQTQIDLNTSREKKGNNVYYIAHGVVLLKQAPIWNAEEDTPLMQNFADYVGVVNTKIYEEYQKALGLGSDAEAVANVIDGEATSLDDFPEDDSNTILNAG